MPNRRESKSIQFQESPVTWQPTDQGSPQSVDSRETRYGSGTTRNSSEQTHYKNIVHLWEFLLELLANETCHSIITWTNAKRWEFKIRNPEELGKRWGAFKKTKQMNYEKLSRALRYYYKKGIIEKVPNQRLAYRFHKLPYKYEPGVTRSRHHGRRINACIGVTGSRHDDHRINTFDGQKEFGVTRHDGHTINALIGQQKIGVTAPTSRQAHSALPLEDTEWSSAFTSVTTPEERSRSLSSFIPTHYQSTLCYPCAMSRTPPLFDLRTRIMLPVTMDTTTLGFEPVKPVAPVDLDIPVPGTSASSVRVSVIRRI